MDRKYSGCINFEPINHNFQDQLLRAKNNLFLKKGLLYSKNFTPRPYRTEPYGSVFSLPYRDQFLEKPLKYQYEAQSVLNLKYNRTKRKTIFYFRFLRRKTSFWAWIGLLLKLLILNIRWPSVLNYSRIVKTFQNTPKWLILIKNILVKITRKRVPDLLEKNCLFWSSIVYLDHQNSTFLAFLKKELFNFANFFLKLKLHLFFLFF